ncbi:T-box transcription factor TBX21 [Latimeria chalumnae]|nr:PREDICTED: T-box transcription factor TBX21 [Latimeria chalumnae]|eukprot:XP_005990126.1 PREDICTED: T-box transcription factor TBX21 [Latimeria chalumnae]
MMLTGTENQPFEKEAQIHKELSDLKMGIQERFYFQEPPSQPTAPEPCSLSLSYPGQPGPAFPSPARFLSPPLSSCPYNPTARVPSTGGQGYAGNAGAGGSEGYPSAGELYPQGGEAGYPVPLQHGFPRTSLYPMPGFQVSGKIQVLLNNYALWAKFHKHQTEMIITKQGRRMFPFLSFNITGLDPTAHYEVYVDIVLADQHHWRYQGGKWVQCGKAEGNMPGNMMYTHPDSPNTGAHWMRQEVSFGKLKLTNNKGACNNTSQMIVLQSLHKYQPRLHIIETKEEDTDETYSSSKSQTFTFLETQFVAVTAYQNADITQLKIDHNPFAKGFRDNFDSLYPTAEGDRITPSPPDGASCQQLIPGARYQSFLSDQYMNPLPQGCFYKGDRTVAHPVQHKDHLNTAPHWYFSAQQAAPSHLDFSSYETEYSGNKFLPYSMKPIPLQTASHHPLGYYQESPFNPSAGWGAPRAAPQYHPRPGSGWYRPLRDPRPTHLPSGEEKGKDSASDDSWKSVDSSDSGLYEVECKRRKLSPYTSSSESSPPNRNGEQCEKDSGSEAGYYSFY